MKYKMIVLASIVLFAGAARDARAEPLDPATCSLSVNPSPVIAVGQTFSYGIDIVSPILPGPFPPITVVFFGSKNGVADIPPSGEHYPFLINYHGHSELTGYGNPGGISGTYVRYAVILAGGNFLCATNPVTVVLQ